MSIWAFFVAGLVLSLTPCTWPTIPIMAMIAAKRNKFGVILYIISAGLTYATLGAIAGYTGAFITPYLQSPVILYVSAVFLLVLAFVQFDLVKFPTMDFSDKLCYNSIIGPVILGVFATLVLSPCITPALAVILGYIATTGDIGKGFLFLFVLSLGINLPLLVAGLLGSKFLPKGGTFMQLVKYTIGAIFVVLAIILIFRAPPLQLMAQAHASEVRSVQKVSRISVTVYTATWCPSCHDFIAKEVPKLRAAGASVRIVDVSNGGGPKGLTGVPTIVVAKNGRVLHTYVGYVEAVTILGS